jgi:hypothetical protein
MESIMTNTGAALYFNATAKELIASNNSATDAVRVEDGGYVASLGVYHELHCLVCRISYPEPLGETYLIVPLVQNELRYFLYRDHFYPGLNILELPKWRYYLGEGLSNISPSASADLAIQTTASKFFVSQPCVGLTPACSHSHGRRTTRIGSWRRTPARRSSALTGKSWKNGRGRGGFTIRWCC